MTAKAPGGAKAPMPSADPGHRRAEFFASVALAAASLLLGLGMAAVISLLFGGRRTSAVDAAGAVRQLIIVATSLIPFVLWARYRGLGPEAFGLTRRRLPLAVVTGLAIGGFAALAQGRSGAVLDGIDASEGYALIAMAGVGFAEEVVYRGYMLDRAVAWAGPVQGTLATSLLFAVEHVPQRLLVANLDGTGLAVSLFVVFGIGLFFALVMGAVKNVVAPGLAHTLVNWSDRLAV